MKRPDGPRFLATLVDAVRRYLLIVLDVDDAPLADYLAGIRSYATFGSRPSWADSDSWTAGQWDAYTYLLRFAKAAAVGPQGFPRGVI